MTRSQKLGCTHMTDLFFLETPNTFLCTHHKLSLSKLGGSRCFLLVHAQRSPPSISPLLLLLYHQLLHRNTEHSPPVDSVGVLRCSVSLNPKTERRKGKINVVSESTFQCNNTLVTLCVFCLETRKEGRESQRRRRPWRKEESSGGKQ